MIGWKSQKAWAAVIFATLVGVAVARDLDDQVRQRITPAEITALAPMAGGTGTSGVSGIQTRVLKGDPNKPGMYTIQLSLPANTRIEAHTHPDDRVATVISGTWYLGYGARFDEKGLKALPPGSFYTEPPGAPHFARTGSEPVVVQITGNGPTGTEYTAQASAPLATMTGIQSKMATVNGISIHYLRSGTGKTPLVLVHGFGETAQMWLPILQQFGKEFTVIAPDLRGIGNSSRPATGYDKKTAATDIHELVKSLGFKRIDLVGHDIGLMVAYAYAAQYPADVAKLALLEAPLPGVGAIWDQIYTNPKLWHFHYVTSPMALDLVKGREDIFLRHFWETFGGNPQAMAPEKRAMYARAYAQDGVMRAAFEYFKAFDPQDAADNKQFAAHKLPMPVLVIAGDKAMGDALAVQAKLVADNVTALKLADTGHWLMEERPEETMAALRKFFSS